MTRPRAILLTHRIPYPPDKGDKIRSWRLLLSLSERYDVALGTYVDDEADWQHTETVRAHCAEALFLPLPARVKARRAALGLARGQAVNVAVYDDPRMKAFVAAERARGPAVEVAFSSGVAPLLAGGEAPLLVDLADADSAKYAAYAEDAGWPKTWLYEREARRLAKLETGLTRTAEKVFLVTPEEAALVAGLPGADASRIDHYRNGVDTESFAPGVAPHPERFDTILTGAMDYAPNGAAAAFFAREVLPLLPGVTFAAVGARPTPAVKALAELPGVTVTGRVADIRPYLAAARVAVAPLDVARGVQNKVLEAMAMGLPVVASSGAARGSGAEPGAHLVTADGAEATAEAVRGLLADPEAAAALGTRARAHCAEHLTWAAGLSRFEAALP